MLGIIAVVASWIPVAVVAARIEHLWASAIWVNRRGAAFAEEASRLKPRQQSQTAAVARILQRLGGGRMPYLFMGIKAYKLELLLVRLHESGRRVTFRLVQVIRLSWRFYVLPVVLAPTIAVISMTEWAKDYDLQVLITSWLLLIGFIAIAAEGYFATHRMGSWATTYHRLPKDHAHETGPDIVQEGAFRYGVPLLLVLPCAFATITVTGSLFDGYDDYPEGIGARIRYGVESGLGLIDFATNGSTNNFALITNVLTLLTACAFVVVGFATSSRKS